MQKVKSLLFRFDESELEALEQCRELLQWKRQVNHDWNAHRKISKTEAVMLAIMATVGELTSQKRTFEERAKPDPLPKKLPKSTAAAPKKRRNR